MNGNFATLTAAAGVVGVGVLGGFVANKLDDDGGANKALTITTAALGAVGVGFGVWAMSKGLNSGDMGGAILGAMFGVTSLVGGGASLAFSGGSLGADLLNLGQKKH